MKKLRHGHPMYRSCTFALLRVKICTLKRADVGAVAVSTTMTEELSAAVKDSDLEPRVNRRRPFDLHWRKAPGARQSNVDTVRLTTGEICCAQCGSRPCPFDHDDEEQRKSHDVAFVGKLVAERNSLRDQLDEVITVVSRGKRRGLAHLSFIHP